MFAEVPVLPVVVPLAAVVFAVLVLGLHRRGLLSVRRAAVALVVCVYAAGVVANTVFPIFLDKPRATAGWSSHLSVVPIAGYEISDAAMNIAVFVPLGILVPLVAPRLSWRGVLGVVAAVSLAIETTQLMTANLLGGGHAADVNDLLFNIVGAMAGYAALLAASRWPGTPPMLDGFRWTRVSRGGADPSAG